jgi:hypothetical protein
MRHQDFNKILDDLQEICNKSFILGLQNNPFKIYYNDRHIHVVQIMEFIVDSKSKQWQVTKNYTDTKDKGIGYKIKLLYERKISKSVLMDLKESVLYCKNNIVREEMKKACDELIENIRNYCDFQDLLEELK